MSSQLLATFTIGMHNLPYCSFDICAIVLNALVLINFAINKKINNAQTKLFYTLAGFSLAASVFNLFCVLQSVFYIAPLICNLLQIFYEVFYNLAGIVFFIYVVRLVNKNLTENLWCRITTLSLCCIVGIGLILNILSASGIAYIDKKVYCSILNAGQLLSTVCAVVLVIANGKKLSFIQRFNVYLFSAVNAFANIWQILLICDVISPQIQLSSFALSIAVLLVYDTLQR
ncbi:MAG: hypothetical protein ACI4MC_03975, partial [Candidatus Coproplasma sp.]